MKFAKINQIHSIFKLPQHARKNCCDFAVVFFVPPVPGVILTISSEMFYMSTIVKHSHLFKKYISGNIVVKYPILRFAPSLNIKIDFVVSYLLSEGF